MGVWGGGGETFGLFGSVLQAGRDGAGGAQGCGRGGEDVQYLI